MDTNHIRGFGEEYKSLNYSGFWDWFIHVDGLKHYWQTEPTYLIVQFLFIFGGLATLTHALWNGKRLPYLWLGTVLHGLVVELICYISPDIDNFWHSQTPVMLFGRRLPLHIVFLYPTFIYNSSVAMAKLRLPTWAEPFAVGLGAVLVDLPYDIMSVRFVHWTWHDTDPNIYDRHYWVPWNSYYFHACFAASFTFWFHGTWRWICKSSTEQKWESSKSWLKEMFCTVLSSCLGMPGGIILFLPIYHPLHDIFKVHSEVTFFILFTVFMSIIWSGVVNSKTSFTLSKAKFVSKPTKILLAHLLVHYGHFLSMALFWKPENEIAIGLHETIGPCNEKAKVQTAFGLVLEKRKFLCIEDYDEGYFDFSCLPKKPSHGASWYTICGVPFENRVEYIGVISAVCILGFTIFYNAHLKIADIFQTFNGMKTENKLKSKKH